MSSGTFRRVAVVGALSLVLAACTAGGTDQTSAPATKGATASGTVTMWHFFSGREAEAIQAVVDDFTTAHPGIKVEVRPEQDDEKMRQAIAAGKGPLPHLRHWSAHPGDGIVLLEIARARLAPVPG